MSKQEPSASRIEAQPPRPGRPARGTRTGRPLLVAFDLLGRRWALRVLWELRDGHLGFRAVQERCGGISSSVLRDRLAELVGAGLLETDDARHYGLSHDGDALLRALTPLSRWAGQWGRNVKQKERRMDWTLEVVVLPVSDISRSIAFYRDRVGFRLDHETRNEQMHVAQLTPPGSGCSIVFGDLPAQNQMTPGSMKGLQLVVPDVAGARRELLERGVEVSEPTVITEADGGTFFGFHDPDGNSWAVQEIRARAQTPLIPHDHAGLREWAGG